MIMVTIVHRPSYIDAECAWSYYHDIDSLVQWERPEFHLYGKAVSSPRLVTFFFDGPTRSQRYTYGPVTLWSSDMNAVDSIVAIREAAASVADIDPKLFNSCLLNKYVDGSNYVSWHADDEKLWGPDPVIVSVSLGASRDFHVRAKADHKQVSKYSLGHGDIVVMPAGMQRTHEHSVPKRPKIDQPRINLTFRSMLV